MKKLSLLILIATLGCSALFGYSKNKTTTIKGYVKTYGNEPFTYLGIETSDGKLYGLKADEDLLLELTEMKGFEIELEGIIIKKNKENLNPKQLKDGVFEVQGINK